MLLHQLIDRSARTWPHNPAVEDEGNGTITYGELAELSDRLRDRLRQAGVQPGDRVGIYLRKSIDAVAAIFGILKTGASYVPVDASAPAARNAYILTDCSVRAVVVEMAFEDKLRAELGSGSEA